MITKILEIYDTAIRELRNLSSAIQRYTSDHEIVADYNEPEVERNLKVYLDSYGMIERKFRFALIGLFKESNKFPKSLEAIEKLDTRIKSKSEEFKREIEKLRDDWSDLFDRVMTTSVDPELLNEFLSRMPDYNKLMKKYEDNAKKALRGDSLPDPSTEAEVRLRYAKAKFEGDTKLEQTLRKTVKEIEAKY